MVSRSETKERRRSRRESTPEPPLQTNFLDLYKSLEFDVKLVTDGGMTMEFDLLGAFPALANALRRALLVEVPSMAPETIHLQQNQSAIPDEVLGHRIGLIPFKADPRKFKYRPNDNKSDHPDYALVYEMKVKAEKQDLKSAKRFLSTRIYSRDFKWIHQPSMHNPQDDQKFRPVFDDIIVNVLRPGQEMDFRVHVVKGIGKDHTKFSPVSVASYRQHPKITLTRPVLNEDAEVLQGYFSEGVIGIEEKIDGSKEAFVKDSRVDSNSRNVLRDVRLKKAVDMGIVEDHFIFQVESIGAMSADLLVKEALRILKERCEYHFLSIGYQEKEREVEIVDESEE